MCLRVCAEILNNCANITEALYQKQLGMFPSNQILSHLKLLKSRDQDGLDNNSS